MIDRTELELRYTYHPPRSGQPEVYAEVRRTALEFALLITARAPDSRERDAALDRLDEVVMWTNAAIARRG